MLEKLTLTANLTNLLQQLEARGQAPRAIRVVWSINLEGL